MIQKIPALTEQDLLVDFTLHNFPTSLLNEFMEKIVKPYYKSNLNAALQDTLLKEIAEQDFVLSHITHIRSVNRRNAKRKCRRWKRNG